MTPVIDRRLTAMDHDDHPHIVQLLGIDPFADEQMRPFGVFDQRRDERAFRKFYTEPDTVVLADELAHLLHVHIGGEIRLTRFSGHVSDHLDVVRRHFLDEIVAPALAEIIVDPEHGHRLRLDAVANIVGDLRHAKLLPE